MRHTWISKVIPPLVLATIAGPVWYAASNRTALNAVPQASSGASATPRAVASAQPLSVVQPVVRQIGKQVTVSVDTSLYKQVDKVEFYVENQLIGAAYAKPYSVSVDAASIGSGKHQVTAKIYTPESTTQSQPVDFVTTGTTAPDLTPPSTSTTPTPVATPPDTSANTLNAPVDLTATATTDGTGATLSWTAEAGATSYQVWRDGSQVATVTTPNYADTGLEPGQTYDYQVVAVNTDGQPSDLSDIAAVTMPIPQQDNSMPTQPDFSNAQSVPDDTSS